MGGPNVVRGGSHSGNVAAEELAREGLLDILSSDYVPASLLLAAFELPRRVPALDLAAAIRTVTLAPAEATGLTDRGSIAIGKRADLVSVSARGRDADRAAGLAAGHPRRMSGVFVCVVGPSGAGKDTLIRYAEARLGRRDDVLFVRRLVTRASGAFEDHDTLSEAEFADGVAGKAFALAWRAHGHGYAVPLAALTAVRRGAVAVCNLSRGAVAEAQIVFGSVVSVLVTAPPEVIATRLAARGRESLAAIEARLKRQVELGDFCPRPRDRQRRCGRGRRFAPRRYHRKAAAERRAGGHRDRPRRQVGMSAAPPSRRSA